jgi:Arc/MetJ-type ribon-helix-helix transcriptional regulator
VDFFLTPVDLHSKIKCISRLATEYYNDHMKAISIKLPDPLFHDLAQRAKSSASSQSEIIRTALAAYLCSDAQPSTASCAERASRWIGMMQGPADLSTNAKHLKGFGQ